MGLWEEAFRNICGSVRLVRQGIPQPAFRTAPELIAIACLWLICCDAMRHCLELASDQGWCKATGERLAGRRPGLHCKSHPDGNEQLISALVSIELGTSLLIWCPSCELDASLIWDGRLSSGPNRFRTFASMLIGKFSALGSLESLCLSLQAMKHRMA